MRRRRSSDLGHSLPEFAKALALVYKESYKIIINWAAQQSLPIETATVSVTTGVFAAPLGFFAHKLLHAIDLSLSPTNDPQNFCVPGGFLQPFVDSTVRGGPVIMARNIAVTSGVGAGIRCVIKRLAGKDDVQTRMVECFGAGVVLSLLTGMRGPNVISFGALFAVTTGVFCKVGEASLLLHAKGVSSQEEEVKKRDSKDED